MTQKRRNAGLGMLQAGFEDSADATPTPSGPPQGQEDASEKSPGHSPTPAPRRAAARPTAAPAETDPFAPPSTFQRQKRENLGVTVQPAYTQALQAFVYAMKADGWNVSAGQVAEHVMTPLLSLEGQQAVARTLAGVPPESSLQRVRRENLNTRVLPEHRQALGSFVRTLRMRNWQISQSQVIEQLLAPLLTEAGRKQLRKELLSQQR